MAISFGDASVNPPADAVPTPDIWGFNENTFSGTISLLDSDDTVQVFIGTSTPVVNLPASTASNPFFVLINAGKEEIKINVTGSGTNFELPAGRIVQVFSDGSSKWYGSVADLSIPVGKAIYWFGGWQQNNGNPFDAGQPDLTILATSGFTTRSQWRMPSSGRLTAFSAIHILSTDTDWSIYKNGILSESSYLAGNLTERTINSFNTTFAEGDFIGVSQEDAGEPQQTRCFIECDLSTYGAMLDLAGAPGANYYLEVDQFYSSGAQPSYIPYRGAMVMPVAMTLTGFQWYTTSAGPTTYEIWKNGVLATSAVTTATVNGVIAVGPISYAAGDQIAIKARTAGNNPNAGRYQLLFDGPGTKFYRWAGDASAGQQFSSWTLPSTFGVTSFNYTNRILMPASGSVVGVGTVCQTIRTADVQLWKNGILSENIASTGSLIHVDTAMTTTFVRGDYLNIRVPVSGADGGDSNYLLAVR